MSDHQIYNISFLKEALSSSDHGSWTQWCDDLAALSPLFGDVEKPSDMVLDEFYQIFTMEGLDLTKPLALYPGSFSPWHEGHEACVLGVSEDVPVLILPDFNPWKEGRETSGWDDLKAIISFVQNHPKRQIYIYPGFLTLEKKNPTVTWLPELPLSSQYLLMGDDTFLQLHRWLDAKRLLEALKGIYVCPRMGVESDLKEQEKLLREWAPELQITFLEHHDYEEISSTEIRKKSL